MFSLSCPKNYFRKMKNQKEIRIDSPIHKSYSPTTLMIIYDLCVSVAHRVIYFSFLPFLQIVNKICENSSHIKVENKYHSITCLLTKQMDTWTDGRTGLQSQQLKSYQLYKIGVVFFICIFSTTFPVVSCERCVKNWLRN